MGMRIAILMNPRSGRNKAERLASELGAQLNKRGHEVTRCDVHHPDGEISDIISGCHRVVVVGGDGTLHHLLSPLCAAQIPVYHLATGTANLVAKYFRFSRQPDAIAMDIEQEHNPALLDVPTANGSPFLIMLSLGMDASVIHRFEASRTTSGGYRAYLGPTASEMYQPRPARVSIEYPEKQNHAMSRPGGLVVVNMPPYALGINPCANADPCDGLLDARMYHARTAFGCAFQFAMMRMRLGNRRSIRTTQLRIRALDQPCAVQIDGENPTRVDGLQDGYLHPDAALDIELGALKIPMHSPTRV